MAALREGGLAGDRVLGDAELVAGSVPAGLEGATETGVLWQAAPGRFLLEVPGTARFLVEGGRRVTVDASPEADPVQIRRYLHMTPLAVLALQQGALAFHASAAVPPPSGAGSGAVLLAGASGAGKSTLLAELLARGWQMLADDVGIVRAGMVEPVAAELALWPDAATRLGAGTTSGTNGGTNGAVAILDAGGRHVVESDRFSAGPVALRRIWYLGTHPEDRPEVRELFGVERFELLTALSYNPRVAAAASDRLAHLRNVAALTGVPLCRMSRPPKRWSVPELADMVEAAAAAGAAQDG